MTGSGSTIPSVEKFLPPLDGATFDEIIVRLTTNFGGFGRDVEVLALYRSLEFVLLSRLRK
jgi:hypothetical protein